MDDKDQHVFEAGTCVKPGTYACVSCDHLIAIVQAQEPLPVCPVCGQLMWMEI